MKRGRKDGRRDDYDAVGKIAKMFNHGVWSRRQETFMTKAVYDGYLAIGFKVEGIITESNGDAEKR